MEIAVETGVLKKREDIADNFKWKTSDLFSDEAKWQEGYDAVITKLLELPKQKESMTQSMTANCLADCLDLLDEIETLADQVYVYAFLRFHEDSTCAKTQALSGKAENMLVKIKSASAFLVPMILSIPQDTLKQFMTDKRLTVYHQYLDNLLRRKEHVLSEAEEQILAEAEELAQAPDTIFAMLNDADIIFPKIKDENGTEVWLTKGRYSLFIQSHNRDVRKNAFEALYSTYKKQQNTLAAILSAGIKKNVFFSRVRKYASTLEKSLDVSNIPVDVYLNLIEATHENLPLLHKYMSIRKKLLGLDELHMYDLYVPLIEGMDVKIPYDEAKQIVVDGLMPLGDEYIAKLKQGFESGWIDVYENVGKRSGAYSWGAYGSHPFVLMNYNDNLNATLTLAHEMGHALHSAYSWETQPHIYSGHQIFVAEVASTVNEALVLTHLINKAKKSDNKKELFYLINYYLEQFRTTFFRQTMFAEFELQAHRMWENGESHTLESLSSIYRDLNSNYFGKDVVIDEQIALEWARIPHFYNYEYYVYQYATGFSAAVYIAKSILENGDSAVKPYIEFLKGGESKYPIDLLKSVGVDMTTTEPIKKALEVFGSLLDEVVALDLNISL